MSTVALVLALPRRQFFTRGIPHVITDVQRAFFPRNDVPNGSKRSHITLVEEMCTTPFSPYSTFISLTLSLSIAAPLSRVQICRYMVAETDAVFQTAASFLPADSAQTTAAGIVARVLGVDDKKPNLVCNTVTGVEDINMPEPASLTNEEGLISTVGGGSDGINDGGAGPSSNLHASAALQEFV
jgi:hypothetical protein